MFLIKLIFIVAGIFMFTVFLTGLTLLLRVRRHLQNPFAQGHQNTPPPGKGDIIEGEYKVLDEEKK